MRCLVLLAIFVCSPVFAQTSSVSPQTVKPNAAMFASVYDRCMGTYASKLLSSGLNDDNIYVASKHLCKEIWQKLSEAALAESNDKKKTNSDLLQFQNMEKQKFPTALTGMRALDKKIQSGQNAPNN